MTHTTIEPGPSDTNLSLATVIVGPLILVWVALILALAVSGGFDVPQSEPALPTLVAIFTPVVLFAATMWVSPSTRAFALSIDPVLLTGVQAWRILGGMFLAVYAFGHLPGLFAWPAGLGDVAVGLAAPFVAWRLLRGAEFLSTRRYHLFHFLGLLDFAIAVATGVIARQTLPGFTDEVTSVAMGQLPLVLIPTLAVPTFIVLHLIALMQSYTAGRNR